jgi:hypothetical protein
MAYGSRVTTGKKDVAVRQFARQRALFARQRRCRAQTHGKDRPATLPTATAPLPCASTICTAKDAAVRALGCRAAGSLPCALTLPCARWAAVRATIAVRPALCRARILCRACELCRATLFAVRQHARPHGKVPYRHASRGSQAHR